MLGDDDLLIILSPQAAVPFFHTVASLQLPEAHTNMIVSVCRPRHEGCTLRFFRQSRHHWGSTVR